MVLFPVTIIEVFGTQAYASINGFTHFVRWIGAAYGYHIGGQILGDSRNSASTLDPSKVITDYKRLILYDEMLLIGSSLCVMAVRGFDAVEKKYWRWKA